MTVDREQIDLANHARSLVDRGYPGHTDDDRGMNSRRYEALWRRVVEHPAMGQKYPLPLLVDRTIKTERVASLSPRGRVHVCAEPRSLADLVGPPLHPQTQHPLTRYVAWVCIFAGRHRLSVEEARNNPPSDLVPLTYTEGVHLLVQGERVLTQLAIDLPGSGNLRYNPFLARWTGGNAQPTVFIDHVSSRPCAADPPCGIAFRLAEVVPISWDIDLDGPIADTLTPATPPVSGRHAPSHAP